MPHFNFIMFLCYNETRISLIGGEKYSFVGTCTYPVNFFSLNTLTKCKIFFNVMGFYVLNAELGLRKGFNVSVTDNATTELRLL